MTTNTNTDGFSSNRADVDLSCYLPQVLNRVAAQMNERLTEELRTIDLPLAHWRIIAILKWRGACTLKEIREWTVIDLSTASRAVKKLEDQGYVLRDWDSEDSRARRINLTPQGETLFGQGWAIVAGFHQYVFGGSDPGDLEQVMNILKAAQSRLDSSVWSELF